MNVDSIHGEHYVRCSHCLEGYYFRDAPATEGANGVAVTSAQ